MFHIACENVFLAFLIYVYMFFYCFYDKLFLETVFHVYNTL